LTLGEVQLEVIVVMLDDLAERLRAAVVEVGRVLPEHP
jgi:hypothetical protein